MFESKRIKRLENKIDRLEVEVNILKSNTTIYRENHYDEWEVSVKLVVIKLLDKLGFKLSHNPESVELKDKDVT